MFNVFVISYLAVSFVMFVISLVLDYAYDVSPYELVFFESDFESKTVRSVLAGLTWPMYIALFVFLLLALIFEGFAKIDKLLASIENKIIGGKHE